MEIEPPDLIAKLEGFHREHPELSAKLIDLLRHLEVAPKEDVANKTIAREMADLEPPAKDAATEVEAM